MRLVVHDYCGHPFQVQLSRNLAMRGHEVTHIYFADEPGPKGVFGSRADNPPSLKFVGITLGRSIRQTALLARRFNDVAYGRRVARVIRDLHPDAVISGNAPTEAQEVILRACKAANIRFVFWIQDIFSVAVSKLVSKQLGFAGKIVGSYYKYLERRQFRDSDSIVVITEDFAPLARSWGGNEKVSVIENWGALDDIPVGEKNNDWSRQHGLNGEFAFIYSGTIGRKHNPELLLRLAEQTGSSRSGLVVVVAQGVSVKRLHDERAARQIDSMKLLPLQPAEVLPDVLATADVLVAMIEVDAGTFAVPSKVLSYMCAGRPILLAAPKENLAARTVEKACAGIVVEPSDEVGFLDAARRLRDNPQLRESLGANGRAFAEQTFDIKRITDRFERVLLSKGRERALGPAIPEGI
jgi:glycosyltransferase involved in cell wall biosynthesis